MGSAARSDVGATFSPKSPQATRPIVSNVAEAREARAGREARAIVAENAADERELVDRGELMKGRDEIEDFVDTGTTPRERKHEKSPALQRRQELPLGLEIIRRTIDAVREELRPAAH